MKGKRGGRKRVHKTAKQFKAWLRECTKMMKGFDGNGNSVALKSDGNDKHVYSGYNFGR